jgi:peptidoglycan/xylan/chitin deacetylase (PgdA/CDA1 family)
MGGRVAAGALLALVGLWCAAPAATAAHAPDGGAGVPPPSSALESPPPVGWIALTFDDGPVEGTYRILDILDEYGVKATFFVSAWRLPANAAIAREIVLRGHSLQSHGFMHNRWPNMSSAAVRRDIARANRLIYETAGVVPSCVRPPFGATSARTTAVAESLGMRVVIWDENSADYAHQSSAALLLRAPGWEPNSVVLAHDTNHYIWAPVLDQIIELLQARGLEFVTLCGYRPDPPRRQDPL